MSSQPFRLLRHSSFIFLVLLKNKLRKIFLFLFCNNFVNLHSSHPHYRQVTPVLVICFPYSSLRSEPLSTPSRLLICFPYSSLRSEPLSTPSRLRDSPGGACGFAPLRRHLRCFGFLPEASLTLQCGPDGPCCSVGSCRPC